MTTTVGLFAIGLDTYWPQFPGLHDRLRGYQARIAARLAGLDVAVCDAGLVDTPDAACAAGACLRAAGCEVVFLFISTYALSSTVLPVVQALSCPVVILNLQPTAAMDYAAINALGDRGAMTGAWLANCQACSVPEVANVFRRTGRPFRVVTGHLEEDVAWTEIGTWVTAAKVRAGLAASRIGLLGRYYGGMLDVYSDVTRLAGRFGCHHELLEMDEVVALRRTLTAAAIADAHQRLTTTFRIDPACAAEELERAARTAAALSALVARHRLGALCYYHEGVAGDAGQDVVTSLIPGMTLLTAEGVPCAGEYETKNVHAMKILDLAHAGGSFSEFYGLDLTDDVVLLGHDGPGHPAISQEQVALVPLPLYHGKPGKGLSIQMQVRHGQATALAVVQGPSEQDELLVAEGAAVPGATLAIGNTNSRYRFPCGARSFIERWSVRGPSHHCAIGSGHHGAWLARLADLLGIGCTRI
jgi:L-arabinose isomerase